MKNSTELYFFTRHYPYSEIGESFIEREIIYLSDSFSKIQVFPSNIHSFIRETPENVQVNDLIAKSKSNGKINLIYIYLCTVSLWAPVFLSEIKERGLFHFISKLIQYLRLMNIQMVRYKSLKKHLTHVDTSNVIFYDYWFINSTLALCFLKKRGIIKKVVVRSHKMDVFDEVQKSTGIPFRDYQFRWIDRMYTISAFNKNYFIQKMGPKWASKIEVSYLGVKNGKNDNNNVVKEPNTKILVSCANMHDHKNIHLIPQVLKRLKTPVKWVHFGEGKNYESVKNLISSMPKNVEIELKGTVSNSIVNEYYRTHQIDAFLSLSSSEGIPVSIMEAIANGIPVFAYAVDGVPEIVKDNVTGMTIHQIEDLDVVAKDLNFMLNQTYNTTGIKEYFLLHFNEEINYKNFCQSLKNIQIH
jgi:colanic acid/amylovoran biosynthesis glycosyltransferase